MLWSNKTNTAAMWTEGEASILVGFGEEIRFDWALEELIRTSEEDLYIRQTQISTKRVSSLTIEVHIYHTINYVSQI